MGGPGKLVNEASVWILRNTLLVAVGGAAYVINFTVLYVQKSFQMCDGAFVTVTSNSLLTELLSSHSSDRVRVSTFMAAYRRERSLTRDTTVGS